MSDAGVSVCQLPEIGAPYDDRPDGERPVSTRADQVPCQPRADFSADHVPSIMIKWASLSSVHEPITPLGRLGSVCADQAPLSVRFGPAVAVQVPRSTGAGCCARAPDASSRATARIFDTLTYHPTRTAHQSAAPKATPTPRSVATVVAK